MEPTRGLRGDPDTGLRVDPDTGPGLLEPAAGSSGRRWPAALLAVGVLGLVLMGRVASGPVGRGSFDAWGHDLVLQLRTQALVRVALVVTTWGSAGVVVPVVFVGVLLVSALPFRQRLAQAGASVGLLAMGLVLRLGLSTLFGRSRPPAHDWAAPASGYAFPSGHTTAAALAAGLLAWTVTRCLPDRLLVRVAAWSVAAAFAMTIGMTRIYLGVHWPSDVVGAWAFSAAWLSGSLLLAQNLSRRRTRPRSTGGT